MSAGYLSLFKHAVAKSDYRQTLKLFRCWRSNEGNLFALTQSLEKLALRYPDGKLTLVRLEVSEPPQPLYAIPLEWRPTGRKGNRAAENLRQLEAEGVEPVILLRSVQRELAFAANAATNETHADRSGVEKHRIWQSKKPLYNAAPTRFQFLNYTHCFTLLTQSRIDNKNSVWAVALATNPSVKRWVLYPFSFNTISRIKRVMILVEPKFRFKEHPVLREELKDFLADKDWRHESRIYCDHRCKKANQVWPADYAIVCTGTSKRHVAGAVCCWRSKRKPVLNHLVLGRPARKERR